MEDKDKEREARFDRSMKIFAQLLDDLVQKKYDHLLLGKPSSPCNLDQEARTIDEISGTETSESTGLLKTSTLDIARQPKIPKMSRNVEDSPLHSDYKIVSTNTQKIIDPVRIKIVSSKMDNPPSITKQSTLIEENEKIRVTRLPPMKRRKRKLPLDTKKKTENYHPSRFGRIAKRCEFQQRIWEDQLKSAVLAVDTSDWPVFIVRHVFCRFNRTFMECRRDAIQTEFSNNFCLPKSFNILCNIDLSNKREPGEKLKIRLPLFILDYKNEIYLLGDNRLESVESELSGIGELEEQSLISDDKEVENAAAILFSMSEFSSGGGFLGFGEDYSESSKIDCFDDLDESVTEKCVIKIKDLDDFNYHEGLGLITLANVLRFFAPNSSIIGKFVGWADLPSLICRTTRVYGEYLLVLRDSEQDMCALMISVKDFMKWKGQCQNDEDMTNNTYKVTGFELTHKLPIKMLPWLSTYKPGKSVMHNRADVYFLSPKPESEWNFEQIN